MSADTFTLDERLQQDCIILGHLPFCQLLLMNNAALPWFILVPETGHTEIYQLDEEQQQKLQQAINQVSEFVMKNFDVTKLNVAAIGNIVSQMHIHVIGRHPDDYCWPGVVWGAKVQSKYSAEQVIFIKHAAAEHLSVSFCPD